MDVFVAVMNVKDVDEQIRFSCYSEIQWKKLKGLSHRLFWHSYLRTLSLTEIYIGFDICDNPESNKYWLNESYETVALNSCSHTEYPAVRGVRP